jgi:hypothetical protein
LAFWPPRVEIERRWRNARVMPGPINVKKLLNSYKTIQDFMELVSLPDARFFNFAAK